MTILYVTAKRCRISLGRLRLSMTIRFLTTLVVERNQTDRAGFLENDGYAMHGELGNNAARFVSLAADFTPANQSESRKGHALPSCTHA